MNNSRSAVVHSKHSIGATAALLDILRQRAAQEDKTNVPKLNELLDGGIPAGTKYIFSGGFDNPELVEKVKKAIGDEKVLIIDSLPADSLNEFETEPGWPDIESQQEAPDDCRCRGAYFDGARERMGNNRYHQSSALAKRRKKLSKISKRRNRQK